MMKSIEELREIARCCKLGLPLGSDLASWLGRSIDDFLAHRSPTIDDALGLRMPRGGMPWWREEATRKRDELLRLLALKHFAHFSISQQAHQIRLMLLRYAASGWRFDSRMDEMPAGYRGTSSELLWRAFKTGAAIPIGERQLRTILAGPPLARCRSTALNDRARLEHTRLPSERFFGS
jgi:hypothetical protein